MSPQSPVSRRTLAEQIRMSLLSVTLLALLIGTVVAVAIAYHALRDQTQRHMQALAAVTATQSQAPLLFRDTAAARDVLLAIPPEEGIIRAEVRDPAGRTFAARSSPGDGWQDIAFAPLLGERVTGDVTVDGERVGTVVLEYGGGPLARSLLHLLALDLVVSLAIGAAVLAIARRLTQHITSPLTQLEAVIGSARRDRDFSRRAGDCPIVEIDRLRLDFHALLDEIQRREADLERSHEVLRRLAMHDPLTGLPNRAMFEARLLGGPQGAVPDEDRLVGVLYFDLDAFKAVNDAFGHSVGDTLLKGIAARLRESLPAAALPARIGGDEFVVLFADLQSEAALQGYAAATQANVEKPLRIGEFVFEPAISVGFAAVRRTREQAGRVLHLADKAMYASKNARREAGRGTRWHTARSASVTGLRRDGGDRERDALLLARIAGEASSARDRPRNGKVDEGTH